MGADYHEIIKHLSIEDYADNFYSVTDCVNNKRLKYYQFQAKAVGADYYYCLKSELENFYVPFIYIFDYRSKHVDESELAKINRKIWTIGEIALAIVVYPYELKIIDTRLPVKITNNGELAPNLLMPVIQNIDFQLKEQIFAGRILENKTKDYLSVSPYVMLLDHIDKNILSKEFAIGCSSELLRSLIVKCILIKYLEEQVDENDKNIFKNNFFASYLPKNYNQNATFCDIIREGDIPKLFNHLSKKFNGGVFDLTDEETKEISNCNLSAISTALDGRFDEFGQGYFWQLYDLKFIPIEFISRLYESFILSVDGKQKEYGAYYTPPHLARLLVDELLSFDKEIDFEDFKLLDPSCGSGIFLVLAYKRLITLWMLQNNKEKIDGREDIAALKNILSNCIYGVDINPDAIFISATSLQIEFTSHFHPKDIELIQFENLIEKGNLSIAGFFKWYKSHEPKFDIIVGNPPFSIDKTENKINAQIGLDDICDNERYKDENGNKQSFPYKNPALTILYKSLDYLLKPSGKLFMIMPSSAFLYNPTSLSYRKTIFSKWNTQKIYDFTPLKDFLWGKTKVATISILIKNEINEFKPIEHIIVRSSYLNHKGAVRFQIDKYDCFSVPYDKAIYEKHFWKTNLLGGGHLHFYAKKYFDGNNFIRLGEFIKNWSTSTGYRTDKSSTNQIDLKGMELLNTENFIEDSIDHATYIEVNSVLKRNIDEELLSPPNILIRLNTNYSMPIVLNNKRIGFFPGVLGIKGTTESIMNELVNSFRANRIVYKTLIKLLSSKIYTQQSGEYSIDAQDIMNLPLKVDNQGNAVPFSELSDMERAIWEDIELLAQCINKTEGALFNNSTIENLEEYAFAFCYIINFIYENGNYKFHPKRIIINDHWAWLTFCHTNFDNNIETNLTEENKDTYNEILKDDITNNGLRINRIVTYLNEPNCISFLKPRALKYWTRSIGYRDAEEIKGIMFNNGF